MRFLCMFLLSLTVAACGGSYLDDPVEEWPDHFLQARCSNTHGYLMMSDEEFAEIEKRGIGDVCLNDETYKIAIEQQKVDAIVKSELRNTSPHEWSKATLDKFKSWDFDDQCRYFWQIKDSGDRKSMSVILRNMQPGKLIKRDIDLILDPKADFGTGMSYYGVLCVGGELTNTSFYPGLGHTWQMELFGSYLYLEGNGDEKNMRVRSWN